MSLPDAGDALRETIAILSDPELMAELAQARREVREGRVFALEEVTAEMRQRGRLPG